MDLATYQTKVLSACFDLSPSSDAFAELGSSERWRLYRHMVRTRLREMLSNGIPRTTEQLGAQYAPLVDAWFAKAPPRTRFIREIVPAFVDFALGEWERSRATFPWIPDLARFESARWITAYRATEVLAADDFDFLRPVALNPTLTLLTLGFRVHEPHEAYAPETTQLALYRGPDRTSVSTFVLRPFAAALLGEWSRSAASAKDAAVVVAQALGLAVNASFVQSLGATVADMIEARIVLGSKPRPPAPSS